MFNLWGSRKAMLVGAVAAGLSGAAVTEGALILDVRAADGTHEVTVAGPSVVPLQLYAVIQGTDAEDNEALGNVFARMKSDAGGLLGNISPVELVAAFKQPGFTAGTPTDVDADTDMDLGATSGNATYVFARGDPTAFANGTRAGNAEEFLLGTFNFQVTGNTGETVVTPIKPATGVTVAGLFRIDGRNSTGADYATSGHIGTRIIIPEPATIGLAAVGALGLLARRRRA